MPKVERLLKFKDTPDGGAVARSTTRGAEYDSGKFVRVDGTRSMTADWNADIGSNGYEIETTYFDVKSDGEYRFGGSHILSAPGTQNLLAGEDAGASLTADSYDNVVAGYKAMYFNEDGAWNVVVGCEAGYGVSGNTYDGSVIIGRKAGYKLTTGSNSVLIGWEAGYELVDQNDSTFVGYQAGLNATGGRQTLIGAYAGVHAGSGNENVAVGWYAGRYIDNGADNVLVGTDAGEGVTGEDYSYVTALGYKSGENLTTGSYNVFVGYYSGQSTTSGQGNVFIGRQCGQGQTTASNLLMIENSSDDTTPLIYGEFDNDLVKIHGDLAIYTGKGIIHDDNVTDGYVLRANGTRYIPGTLALSDLTDCSGYAAPGLTFTTANAAGSAETLIRTDASLAIFDATTPEDVDLTGAVGSAAFAARRDHEHALDVAVAPTWTAAHTFTGTAQVGDGASSYSEFDGDGWLTLAGDARIRQHIEFTPGAWQDGGTAPTATQTGDYPGEAFTIGDSSVVVFQVPEGADLSEDINVHLRWYCSEAYATNSGEIQWKCAFSAIPYDDTEAVDGAGYTGDLDPGDDDLPATAKFLTTTTLGTLTGSSLALGDIVALEFSRVAIDGGNNPTAGEPVAVLLTVEYWMDQLGTKRSSAGPLSDGILLETGDYMLLETGDYTLKE